MDPAGIEPASPARQAGIFPLDHEPSDQRQSGEWGSNPRSPASMAGGFPLSYPCDSGPPGNRTPISAVRWRHLPIGPAAPFSRGPAGARTRTPAIPERCGADNTSRPINLDCRIQTGVRQLMRPCRLPDPVSRRQRVKGWMDPSTERFAKIQLLRTNF